VADIVYNRCAISVVLFLMTNPVNRMAGNRRLQHRIVAPITRADTAHRVDIACSPLAACGCVNIGFAFHGVCVNVHANVIVYAFGYREGRARYPRACIAARKPALVGIAMVLESHQMVANPIDDEGENPTIITVSNELDVKVRRGLAYSSVTRARRCPHLHSGRAVRGNTITNAETTERSYKGGGAVIRLIFAV